MTTGRAVRNCFFFVSFCSPLLPAFGQSVDWARYESLQRQAGESDLRVREIVAERELLEEYKWTWWLLAVVATGFVMYQRGVVNIEDPLSAYSLSGKLFAACWVFSFVLGFIDRIFNGWVGPGMTALAVRNVSGWAALVCGALAYRAHLQINSRKTT